jgi:hypothetical protein
MLVLVIAPFFTSFLVRTLSWKLILSDNGLRRRRLPEAWPDSGGRAGCSPPTSPSSPA